jgi:hypothetical protein
MGREIESRPNIHRVVPLKNQIIDWCLQTYRVSQCDCISSALLKVLNGSLCFAQQLNTKCPFVVMSAAKQCDQIGRIFAYWAIVYPRQVFRKVHK